MKAFCYNPSVIELDFSDETQTSVSILDSKLQLFVNGYGRDFVVKGSKYLLLNQPLKALDQTFVRFRQRSILYDSGVVRVQVVLDSSISHAFKGTEINPLSLNPIIRSWLVTDGILDANSLSTQDSLAHAEYMRASFNPKGSSLTKIALDARHPGKVGESISVKLLYRSTQPIEITIRQNNVFGKTFLHRDTFPMSDWTTVSTSFELPAVGEVLISLIAPISTNYSFADFKHVVISSAWRGDLFIEDLSKALLWTPQGDVFPASDTSKIPSWTGCLSPDMLVLLSKNSLTLGEL